MMIEVKISPCAISCSSCQFHNNTWFTLYNRRNIPSNRADEKYACTFRVLNTYISTFIKSFAGLHNRTQQGYSLFTVSRERVERRKAARIEYGYMENGRANHEHTTASQLHNLITTSDQITSTHRLFVCLRIPRDSTYSTENNLFT
jgi:hypothetical protein